MDEGHEEVGIVFKFMKEHNIPRSGYCFFHQQDIERCLDKKAVLYIAFSSLDGDQKKRLMVGQRIVSLLTKANFDVTWNGSTDQRIAINNFIWDKQFDQELSSTERTLSMMEKEC